MSLENENYRPIDRQTKQTGQKQRKNIS